ncbi:MAG: 3-deoxy-8-phosphooctulonate synthase [Gammaproteobacteria bacterium]|mgnify:CR=1 FL=1|nr:3-deoxy-8-phosphooctulonate synthase [Gammaproteobacteria bacterium]|tara:strand:+ start:12058 stop:12834 length:777 start_codon:yes stop_codon:yes gene_type:complete
MIRIIAGPCQHETLEQSLETAKHCAKICKKNNIEYIFKASFDKANRSSMQGIRGVGLQTTMEDFRAIKEQVDCKTLTDVHNQNEILKIAAYYNDAVDVLQIPAFLSRQTDLIKAACKTNKIVNIKKGQFLAPWDVKGILSKTEGAKEVWITERGTSFGYNSLVVDYTGLMFMLEHIDSDIVFDVTHSVQKPGGLGTSSGGNRDYVPGLARSGSALGIKSFFIEVHPVPDQSPSDGPNMLRLDDFEEVVNDIVRYSYTG